MPASAIPGAIQDGQASVKVDQLNFEQSIAELSKIFDTKITLSNTSYLPQKKLSIALEQATFEQALKETLRKADLQSHALIWEQENKALQIWIFPSDYSQLNKNSVSNQEENPYVLNIAQLHQLGANKGLNSLPLTPEQMQKLNPRDEEIHKNKTLSTDQMQQLGQDEEKNPPKILNEVQMQRLNPCEKIDYDHNKKLTEQQMHLLEKKTMEP
jgi:hypothetical protein